MASNTFWAAEIDSATLDTVCNLNTFTEWERSGCGREKQEMKKSTETEVESTVLVLVEWKY